MNKSLELAEQLTGRYEAPRNRELVGVPADSVQMSGHVVTTEVIQKPLLNLSNSPTTTEVVDKTIQAAQEASYVLDDFLDELNQSLGLPDQENETGRERGLVEGQTFAPTEADALEPKTEPVEKKPPKFSSISCPDKMRVNVDKRGRQSVYLPVERDTNIEHLKASHQADKKELLGSPEVFRWPTSRCIGVERLAENFRVSEDYYVVYLDDNNQVNVAHVPDIPMTTASINDVGGVRIIDVHVSEEEARKHILKHIKKHRDLGLKGKLRFRYGVSPSNNLSSTPPHLRTGETEIKIQI